MTCNISKIGIPCSSGLRSCLTHFWPMRAPDFSFLTNKIFEKKFNHERDPEEQGITILDMSYINPNFLKNTITWLFWKMPLCSKLSKLSFSIKNEKLFDLLFHKIKSLCHSTLEAPECNVHLKFRFCHQVAKIFSC